MIEEKRGDAVPVLLSAAVVFFVFSAYNILKALRDAIGAENIENIKWLWACTLILTLIVAPIYAWTVGRYPRRVFLPLAYRGFACVVLGFYAALRWLPAEQADLAGRIFYNWVSLFGVYGVTVFWGFMADIYGPERAKKLYGPIAAGGSLGAITGNITTTYAEELSAGTLLLIAIALLEVAAQLILWVNRTHLRSGGPKERLEQAGEPVGGSVGESIAAVFSSRYLATISGYIFLFVMTSAVLQILQAQMIAERYDTREAMTKVNGQIFLAVNLMAMVMQSIVTPRAVRWLGLTACLALLPVFSILGFSLFAVAPLFLIWLAFGVLRQGFNYGVMKPSQEMLYTVVAREQKYKSKAFIDTVIYRGGDTVAAFIFDGLTDRGVAITAISWLSVPVSIAWLTAAVWLGRRQTALAAAQR